jgi:hypothetical protein
MNCRVFSDDARGGESKNINKFIARLTAGHADEVAPIPPAPVEQ